MPPIYPTLPIITPDPPPAPRKTQAEKYGGLLYAGIAGLIVTLGLLAYFGLGVRQLRATLGAIYRLHDARLPTAGRIEAAYSLRHDPNFTQRQAYDIAVEGRSLPPLARYLVAESLTAEATEGDPRAYALAVERSTGWPDWFRLLMLRPMAYAAGTGRRFPAQPLEDLTLSPDSILSLWARYILVADGHDRDGLRGLISVAGGGGPRRDLAALFVKALTSEGAPRAEALDRATLWVRSNHPGAAEVWKGWAERDGRLIPAPESRRETRRRRSDPVGWMKSALFLPWIFSLAEGLGYDGSRGRFRSGCTLNARLFHVSSNSSEIDSGPYPMRSSRTKRNILIFIIISCILCIIFTTTCCYLHCSDCGPTIYAKGFSEVKFASLRVGMTSKIVVGIIGEPLDKTPLPDGTIVWNYSTREDFTCDYYKRAIMFKNDKADHIFSSYWED